MAGRQSPSSGHGHHPCLGPLASRSPSSRPGAHPHTTAYQLLCAYQIGHPHWNLCSNQLHLAQSHTLPVTARGSSELPLLHRGSWYHNDQGPAWQSPDVSAQWHSQVGQGWWEGFTEQWSTGPSQAGAPQGADP